MELNGTHYCDGCAAELEDGPSEFYIKMDYGSTDPCFQGSGIDELQIEYELDDDSEYSDTLAQEDYHYCDDCQSDHEGYMKRFEREARSTRAKILLKFQKAAAKANTDDDEG